VLEKLPGVIGESLREHRAGVEATIFYRLARTDLPRIEVRSAAFPSDGLIPILFTADGEGYSPPLQWRNVPSTAASTLLVVEDADSPTLHPLVHTIVVNMQGADAQLDQGAINSPDHEGWALQVGRNSFLRQSWLPPDPPPGHGVHRYVFQIFALREGPAFSSVPGRQEIFDAVESRALAGGYLIGRYSRDQKEEIVDDETVGGQLEPAIL
jgi:Raf kinase inhibitor-like YbhB/YbcL family protein